MPPRLVIAAIALTVALGAAPAPLAITIDPGPVVLSGDFPDPFLLAAEGGILAYATNDMPRANVPMAFSRDIARWRRLPQDALPRLPAWAKRGWTWAPEVLAVAGGFRLYFTARHRATGQQCVGVASAARATGPFVSPGATPLVCQHALGGSIDASPFRDIDGRLFLLYKNDGNHPSARTTTSIWSRPLAPDGLAFTGEPVAIAVNDRPDEGAVVEAPTMLRTGGRLILLYSTGDFGWPKAAAVSPYAIGAALCDGPQGPCRDLAQPVLASRAQPPCLSGPGHQSVLAWRSALLVAFHAWETVGRCRRGAAIRQMHLGQLRVVAKTPAD